MRLRKIVSVGGACVVLAACGGGSAGSGGAGGGPTTGNGGSGTGTAGSASSSGSAVTSTSVTSTSVTSTSVATSSSSSGGASLCASPPANTAPQIDDVYTTAAMPAMGTGTGGTIVSGTYYMTGITNYENSGSDTHQDTMVVDASASTLVVVEVNGGTAKAPFGADFTTAGSMLVMSLVCPQMATAPFEYTFANGVLTVYDYNSKSVSVWTKQ